MSLQTLEKTLKAAIKPDGSLDFTGTLVESSAIGALIARLFPAGALPLAGAAVTLDPGGQSLTVGGKTGVVKVTAADVTITLTLNAQQTLEMVCAVSLADGWTMSELFAVLPDAAIKALVIHDTRLLLTTLPYVDPISGDTLAAGLNLSGRLQVTETYSYLAIVLGQNVAVPIAGPIGDFGLPLFDFTTASLTGELATVAITGVRLSLAVVNIAPKHLEPIASARTALIATLTIGGKPGTLTAALPADASSLALSVDFTALTLADFTQLQPFIDSADPFDVLPAPVKTEIAKIGGAFGLRHLGLSFNLAKPAFLTADLAVVVNLREFEIFSVIPELRVTELDLMLRVDNTASPAKVTFGAQAEIQIGTSYAVILSFQTQFDNGYRLTVAQKPGVVLKLADVLRTFVPGLTGFPALDVETFSLTIAPTAKRYTFDAIIKSDWDVIAAPKLTLTEIDILAAYDAALQPPASGGVKGLLTLQVDGDRDNDVLITLAAQREPGNAGWNFSGNTGPDQPIPVGHLAEAITTKFSATVQVPKVISGLTIQNLELTFNTETKAFHFGTMIMLPFDNDIKLDLTVSIDVEKIGGAYEANFGGTFLIKQYQFAIVFNHKTSGTNTLIATYSPTRGTSQSVKLVDLLAGISPSLATDVPVDIQIDLKDVKFVFYTATPDNKLAFGLDVGIPIDLSNIPIVGDKLPKDFSLAISNLQGVYATRPFDDKAIGNVNELLPPGIVPFPGAGLVQGANLSADMVIGTTTKSFVLAGVQPKKAAARQTSALALSGAGDDSYKWIDINKQIGIFQFNRAGAGYEDNVLSVAMDASVSLGPLSFTMDGLSVGSPLGEFKPVFGLNGLGLAFNRAPLTISGNFLKVKEPSGTSYYGQVAVQFNRIGFSALGGWSPDASPPSFFLYASIDVPLGGPPFLFVTGLAAGLGINRNLLLPTIDDLPGYILLPGKAPQPEGSPSATVAKILPKLQKYFQVKPGQFWVAAGLKFTSFEMVDAFVLVTVSFGVDFQLGVLGTCAMSLPSGTKSPVAYIEVDLIASFTPSAGLLAVDGRISPQSFLFGGFVKLSGGFAFYLWFAGDNAGDFVISIGGYYPSFNKPDHYPTVPRLKLEFSLGPLSVTGTSYFALTPSMLMAGINMSAVWKSGPIKAWLDARLDFLIAWAPFHYEAEVYLGLGVALDLGLFTISLQIGAEMFVWGAPFGGRALIDLDVISFIIEFGAPRELPPPVGWDAFKTNFLPKDSAQKAAPIAMAAALPHAVDTESNIIKAQVKTGLVDTAVPGYDWIIAANGFDIVIASTVPANAATWAQPGGKDFDVPIDVSAYQAKRPTLGQPYLQLPKSKTYTYSDTEVWNPKLDIGPMKKTGVTSTLAISVSKVTKAGVGDPVTDLTVIPQLAASNTALWLDQAPDNPNLPRLLPKTLTGFGISPIPRKPDRVSDVPLIQLLFTEGNDVDFRYQKASVVPGYKIDVTQEKTPPLLVITISGAHDATMKNQGYVLEALGDQWVSTQRGDVATDLRSHGFDTYAADQINLSIMATDKMLTDWPIVRQLGA